MKITNNKPRSKSLLLFFFQCKKIESKEKNFIFFMDIFFFLGASQVFQFFFSSFLPHTKKKRCQLVTGSIIVKPRLKINGRLPTYLPTYLHTYTVDQEVAKRTNMYSGQNFNSSRRRRAMPTQETLVYNEHSLSSWCLYWCEHYQLGGYSTSFFMCVHIYTCQLEATMKMISHVSVYDDDSLLTTLLLLQLLQREKIRGGLLQPNQPREVVGIRPPSACGFTLLCHVSSKV